MQYDHQFGPSQDHIGGPLLRASFADLDEAKGNARNSAEEERQDFFACRFEDYAEITRVFPTVGNKTAEVRPDATLMIGSARREE
ncbi:MAG: hypothetical protein WAO35_15425 [Terriglobia bacterium]